MQHISLFLLFTSLSGDPLVGVWRANFEKSPDATPQISTFERDGDGFVNTNGPLVYKFKLDGKEHPVTSSAAADGAVWKQTGPLRFEHEMRKGGKAIYSVVTDIAPDGKTRKSRHTAYFKDGTTAIADRFHDRIGGSVDPANPMVGKWRLRRVMEWSHDGGMLHFRADLVSYAAAEDGKDYRYVGSNTVDAVALKRLSPHAIEVTLKKAGKPVAGFTHTVSADGRTLTSVSPSNGSVVVYDRVK